MRLSGRAGQALPALALQSQEHTDELYAPQLRSVVAVCHARTVASVYSSPRAPHQPASECPCVPFAPRRTSLIRIYPLTRDTAGRPLLRMPARCMSRNVRIVPIGNGTQASSSSARRRAAGSAPTHSLATSPAPRLRMYIGLFAPLPLVATTIRAALRGLHYARPSHRCSPQQAGRRTTETNKQTNKQASGAEPTVRDGLERRRNRRPQRAIWDYTRVPSQLFGTQVKYLRFFKYFYQYLVPRTPPARTPPPVRRLAKLAHARSPPGECTADDMGRATPRGTGPLAHRSSTTSSSACRRSRCLSCHLAVFQEEAFEGAGPHRPGRQEAEEEAIGQVLEVTPTSAPGLGSRLPSAHLPPLPWLLPAHAHSHVQGRVHARTPPPSIANTRARTLRRTHRCAGMRI